MNAAYRLGIWSALTVSVIGAIYFIVMVSAIVTGHFTTLPPDWLQLFCAVVSLATCSMLIVLTASLHAVVQQSIAAGKVDGLNGFLPYGERSVMLELEYLGWSWFLGLALICAAPSFSHSTLERCLRGLLLLYGVLALISAIGFLTGSLLSPLDFVAWGMVLIFVTAMLAALGQPIHNLESEHDALHT